MYEIILQAYGWDQGWRILTLMAANSKIYGGSGLVRDAVIRGDIAAGITIDFYGYTAMHQNPACEYIIPKGATIINADPIAIIKGTKHPVAAAAFVAWVLSEYGGQQVWLDPDINRLPINPLVFNTTAGKERPDLYKAFQTAIHSKGINFNETLAMETERAMQFYFKATLVNAHDDLQSTWAHMVKAYLDGKITKEQFQKLEDDLTAPIQFKDPLTGKTVTFTEQYAIKIDPQLNNQKIYQALMSEWEHAARTKYLNVYNELQQMLQGQSSGGQQTSTSGTASGAAPAAASQTTQTAKTTASTAKIAVVVIGAIVVIGAAYFVMKK
jgi:spermidine/putrescine-binding protein